MNIKCTVFWDLMSYSVAGKYQNFFHPEDRSNSKHWYLSAKVHGFTLCVSVTKSVYARIMQLTIIPTLQW